MLTAIRNWVIRTMMKSKGETGIVRTMPKKDLVELNTQITAQRLMQNGIDPQSLKNADQVENVIRRLESRPTTEGVESTQTAKVFDMEGKEIPKGSKIMGGKAIDDDLPPPGSRGGPDDIAAPIQSADESLRDMMEAEIKKKLDKGNKEGIARIRVRQKMVEDAIDNVSPGFSGDRKVDAELVAEDLAERMGKVYDDLPTKERLKLYDEAYTALSKKRFEDFAQGGRAGFANGTGAPSIKYDFDKQQGPMGPVFETNKVEEAIKEIIRRGVPVDFANIPITDRTGIMLGFDDIGIAGEKDLLGGELRFGGGKNFGTGEKKFGFEFRKPFNQGGRTGFFLGSANPKGLGLLRKILNYMSKTGKEQGKFQGVDLSGLDMLRLSNPKALNRLLEDVRGKVNVREGIMGTDTVRAQQQALREKRKGLTEKSLDVAKAMKADDDKIRRRVAEEAEYTIIPRMKKQLMEGMGMSKEEAEKTARGMAEAAQNIRLIDDPPIITKEGLLQLENVLKNLETGGKKKRDLNADGGRIGFKDGMTRRTFLKIFGGLVSLPIIGKIVKPLKLTTGVKKVPIIKTDNVPGKPEWFDQLVNKVIVEGDDVTKRFATGERQSIHQKTLDDGSVVRVTEDIDDGAVRVEYQSEQNVYGDDVLMQYKKPLPDEGDPRPTAQFDVAESGPVGRGGRSPDGDDYEIEVDEVGGTSIKDLDSDVSKLKEYATGKGPTMKEFIQNKKRREKAAAITDDIDGAQSDAVVRRQGDLDLSDYDDGMASGGIARMLGE
jgi:hypothetical protein